MDRLTTPGWIGLYAVVGACLLLIVPLGLGALGRGRGLVRCWPAAAGPAVVALLLPRGWVAGLLCVPYLAGCLAVPVVLRRERLTAFAAACLPVAAVGLLAERAGVALFGFPAGVLGLTAAHFHVAGFGALLLITLTGSRRWWRFLAPVGVAVVGAGFLAGRTPLGQRAGDVVELAGAAVLTAGLWLAVANRFLTALAVLTMTLALLYAAGQVLPIPHLDLTWMVLTHGVLNAAAVLTALVVSWVRRPQPWSAHRWSHRIGAGRERFDTASAALLGWEMHRRAGAHVTPDTPAAATGLRMASSFGFGLREPCEVLEVVRAPGRTVMHYRALPGHLFDGDERFTVRLDDDDAVRLEVAVRSRPVRLLVRLFGPVVPLIQWLFIARCAAVLRRAPRSRPVVVEPAVR
ncbi:YndJ family transporter [Paractinoplanes ferrugineus]|nr:YndJ family transporter [Actinoplanes ferrugineus]